MSVTSDRDHNSLYQLNDQMQMGHDMRIFFNKKQTAVVKQNTTKGG